MKIDLTTENTAGERKDNKTAPKLTKDILNHVDLDTLLEVQEMCEGRHYTYGVVSSRNVDRMGDEMIDIFGGRLNEFIQAGYREDNVLIPCRTDTFLSMTVDSLICW